ncbi:hypothetical protein ACJX0J_020435, partial [Zea mays]
MDLKIHIFGILAGILFATSKKTHPDGVSFHLGICDWDVFSMDSNMYLSLVVIDKQNRLLIHDIQYLFRRQPIWTSIQTKPSSSMIERILKIVLTAIVLIDFQIEKEEDPAEAYLHRAYQAAGHLQAAVNDVASSATPGLSFHGAASASIAGVSYTTENIALSSELIFAQISHRNGCAIYRITKWSRIFNMDEKDATSQGGFQLPFHSWSSTLQL